LAGRTDPEFWPAAATSSTHRHRRKILAKVQRIKALCQNFKVSIKAAALHFSLTHPASAAIIPGASKPERIAEDHVASR
jgi:aryl-alcohol dehydrogenase-like predicted oxidoreductase